MASFKQLTDSLQRWNREVFGNIFRQKSTLLARIGGIQKAQERHFSPYLYQLENQLTNQLNEILRREKIFWHKSQEASGFLGEIGIHTTST